MISEFVMNYMGWDGVWMPGALPVELRTPAVPLPPLIPEVGACLVGTWTGPDGDLLCVRECDTAEEAEKWLSPPGRMIIDAVARSVWLRFVGARTSPCDTASRGSRSSTGYRGRPKHSDADDSPPTHPAPSRARDSSKRGAPRTLRARGGRV